MPSNFCCSQIYVADEGVNLTVSLGSAVGLRQKQTLHQASNVQEERNEIKSHFIIPLGKAEFEK